MTFFILYAALDLAGLILIFGLTSKFRGWKTALITTGAAFVLSLVVLVVTINLITAGM